MEHVGFCGFPSPDTREEHCFTRGRVDSVRGCTHLCEESWLTKRLVQNRRMQPSGLLQGQSGLAGPFAGAWMEKERSLHRVRWKRGRSHLRLFRESPNEVPRPHCGRYPRTKASTDHDVLAHPASSQRDVSVTLESRSSPCPDSGDSTRLVEPLHLGAIQPSLG